MCYHLIEDNSNVFSINSISTLNKTFVNKVKNYVHSLKVI